MNITHAYIFLVLAIVFELLSTSFLKDTNGFTNLYPSLIVIAVMPNPDHVAYVMPIGIKLTT